MQNGFFQKVFICMFIGAACACLVEFYKNVIESADQSLNGKYQHVRMNYTPSPKK